MKEISYSIDKQDIFNNQPDVPSVREFLLGYQKRLVSELERFETTNPNAFKTDSWMRERTDAHQNNLPDLWGEGISCVLEEGSCFERAAVLFSHMHGTTLPPASRSSHQKPPGISSRIHASGNASNFEVLGVSSVVHPRNPFVPTVHFNIRCFILFDGQVPSDWWFGGGMDLTPYYPFLEDAVHFHSCCREALDPFGVELYPKFKKLCDNYFFLKHRKEARGIGGIFFDELNSLGFDKTFSLARNVSNAFVSAYPIIVDRRFQIPYGEEQRSFQLYRRGRYVEFNLLYDRGTSFGLQSGGRAESILCSMPPLVRWEYNFAPNPNAPEADLAKFLIARDWI